MKVLLDTNAYVAFRRGHERVVELVRQAEGVVMSTVVVGELLYGFRHGTRYPENFQVLQDFLDSSEVIQIDVTWSTAERFGLLSSGLRRKGKPIPTNDVWIGAHVFESNSELMTFDRHFAEIDNLPLLMLES
ncbi:type II toxin-antitoxin system VapC family toxin [bacterium]|nr:type II toxin-antitoxin system VapC family toxin [bacterium]